MQDLPAGVRKYLNKYADEKYKVEWNKQTGINNVIVIPAIAEFENIKVVLTSLSKNDPAYFASTIIVFVINNSRLSESVVKANNSESLEYLRSIICSNGEQEFFDDRLQIGLIDASSDGKELNEKDSGVGLARKIGMDSGLTLFDYTTDHKKLIISLDADCTVKQNYLAGTIEFFRDNNSSVGIVNFEHKYDGTLENNAAIICYEIFLRYYVAGLSYANSEYAFQTVGSTIVCDNNSYIKIAGMNKNKAAEDFYFLEKLSKNFSVDKINTTTVYPSKRSSWRVPFGTGKSIMKFLNNPQDEYFLYNPDVFEILKSWLELYYSEDIFIPGKLLENSKSIHTQLHIFLDQQGFKDQWGKIISNTKSEKQLSYQQKIWFDGFKTLKLIHHLRDTAYPQIDMFDALDRFFSKLKIESNIHRKTKSIPDLETQIKYLKILKQLDK